MAKAIDIEFAFFTYLWGFYKEKRGAIRKHYRELSKRFLDFNDPDNATAFLRTPQFEALEIYVFLKEYLDNAKVHEIFREWAGSTGKFDGRNPYAQGLFEQKDQYERVFDYMQAYEREYPNYIFALTMGTGKTILMATCIFYEFLLSNKFPSDPRYCHNALVFAPDRTVLESLREIQTFDMSRVVPPEYLSFLSSHIQFHFLDDTGISLNTLDGSRFNLIISNTQKIILKRQNATESLAERLFKSGKPTYQPGTVYAASADLYEEEPEDETALTTNQRFEKVRRLPQLGIYIDEAHHAFGADLAKDMLNQKNQKTSLRATVDELARSLEAAGTHVVACYNYTGTPYVGRDVLPEVVYAYGLKEAIQRKFLKDVVVNAYDKVKNEEFVQLVVDNFVANTKGLRPENLVPKLAFFAPTIKELEHELRPAVEKALARHGISSDRLLINVGDDKLTTNDEIREFNRLDTPESEKQFILLVNKGREGWNCRSLFGVALFRKPKSKVFVLQAAMRCLRSIGDIQYVGNVYLSTENRQILEEELEQNFRVSIADIQTDQKAKRTYQVRVQTPPIKLRLKRVRKLWNLREKELVPGADLEIERADTSKYELIHTQHRGLLPSSRQDITVESVTYVREKQEFTELTLVAEVARYLNKRPLEVENLLAKTEQGIDAILAHVNAHNELLYDWVIPKLFGWLYEIESDEQLEEYEVQLVKQPPSVPGYYEVTAAEEMAVNVHQVKKTQAHKSFHLDTYCFDSKPERALFWDLLRDEKVKQVYFTGMLTHGQSEFYVQYIDPDSHTIRSYYPDFLVQKDDGDYLIVEVKADYQVDDPLVLAKKSFAEKVASVSNMTYSLIPGTAALERAYRRYLPLE